MKLKEIAEHMPGFFRTRNTWRSERNDIVYIEGTTETNTITPGGWRSTVNTVTKLVARGVKLSADGSCAQKDETSYPDNVMPAQVAEALTDKQAHELLSARAARRERTEEMHSIYTNHAEHMVQALADAGFPGATTWGSSVQFNIYTVVQWLRANGYADKEGE